MEQVRLLGLPLNEALNILHRAGETPRVLFTAPLRRDGQPFDTKGRTPFVVSVRGDHTIIAAYFCTQEPRRQV